MAAQQFSVGIVRGDGLVARFGDVVVFVGDESEEAGRLLSLAAAAARTRDPGTELAHRLGQRPPAVPFGAVIGNAAAIAVFLFGPVVADVDSRGRLVGGNGVREVLPSDVAWIGVHAAAARVPAARRFTDLTAGVVPGGGFVAVGLAAEASETVATEVIPAEPGTVVVARTPVETAAAVSVVGVLATPAGAVYPLDRSYVLGRSPLSDEAVASAAASPIVVEYDPYVSRVHAYVTVVGREVSVRDAATAAGTFIAMPGDAEWTQVGTSPVPLPPGATLRIGEWSVTYRVTEA